jgi:hypothetical protein
LRLSAHDVCKVCFESGNSRAIGLTDDYLQDPALNELIPTFLELRREDKEILPNLWSVISFVSDSAPGREHSTFKPVKMAATDWKTRIGDTVNVLYWTSAGPGRKRHLTRAWLTHMDYTFDQGL